jgi:hypothetical protein
MIEGIALLEYAYNDQENRCINWEESFYLNYYLVYKERFDLGLDYDSKKLEEYRQELPKRCPSLIANQRDGYTKKIDDIYYYRSWYKSQTISEIINIYCEPFYKQLWSDFSSWHHWEPRFALQSIKEEGGRTTPKPIEENTSVLCLIAGIECFINTIFIVCELYKDKEFETSVSEIGKAIEEITREYKNQ